MSTTPYDDAFKDLAEQDPEALLLLLGALDPEEHATITLLSRELRASKQMADQPYLVTTPAGTRIVHVEAQTRYDAEMPERMLDYGLRLWLSQERRYAIDSYVLLLTPNRLPAEAPDSLNVRAGSISVSIEYHLVRLWEMDAAMALAMQRDQLLPFVPLMDGGLSELEASAKRVVEIEDEEKRDTLVLSLLVLSSLRYNPETIVEVVRRESMYNIPLEQIKETPGYQYLFGKAIEEGQLRGRREAVIDLFSRLAEKRFPGIQFGHELEAVSDLEGLEQLCIDLDQVPDEASLQKRLAELARPADEESPENP